MVRILVIYNILILCIWDISRHYGNSILVSNFFCLSSCGNNAGQWVSYNERSIYFNVDLHVCGGCNHEDEHQPPTVWILARRRKILDEKIHSFIISHALICIIKHSLFYITLSSNNCYNDSKNFDFQAFFL